MIRLKLIGCILATCILVAGIPGPIQGGFQEIPTSEGARKLRIVPANAPGGMAIDLAGNIYVSDQGDGSPGAGLVKMFRGIDPDNPITILKGLTRPGDIELSLDGRSLLIGQDNASIPVIQSFFGISVRFTYQDGSYPFNGLVFVETDFGTNPAVAIGESGYFHVPDILKPGQTSSTVTITLQEGNKAPRVFYNVQLIQDLHNFDKPFGQRVIQFHLGPI